MTRRWIVACLLGALALAPAFAGAEASDGSLEQSVIEMGPSKAQHQALAKYYKEQAAGARAEARRHAAMGTAYSGGKSGNPLMTTHCKSIAEKQEAIAKEFDELAKLHESEAAKAN